MTVKIAEKAINATNAVRKSMARVTERAVRLPVRSIYDDAITQMTQHLRRQLRGKGSIPVDTRTTNLITTYLVSESLKLADQFGSVLSGATRGTLNEGVSAVSRYMYQMNGKATALDNPVRVNRIVAQYEDTIEANRHAVVERMKREFTVGLLRKVKSQVGEETTVNALIDGADAALEGHWAKLERIIVTESSAAFNRAQRNAIEAISKDFPNLWIRWTERVNDATGVPMDDVVGEDSIILHGQIARPIGGLFTMPSDARSETAVVGSWAHPPDRPNDRAVITPWAKEWGIPAWIYQRGQKIPL